MRIPRIHQPGPLPAHGQLELTTAATHYVIRVLRLSVEQPLILFDGSGGECAVRIVDISKRKVRVQIEGFHDREVESPLSVTLLQGISKGERMDYTIQKATELGITRIIPLITERCNVRLDDARQEKKCEHWRSIAVSACEQCGRNRIPVIDLPLPLLTALQDDQDDLRLVLDPQGGQSLASIHASPAAVRVLIGPEGGLSDTEMLIAERAGYQGVRLGPRILRTETAGLAALSLLQMKWGDLQ